MKAKDKIKKENYDFPYSLRYCYVCEAKKKFMFKKKIGHSICLTCECPGVSWQERKILNIKKRNKN